MITRRSLIAGLIAAPAIVKFSSIMPLSYGYGVLRNVPDAPGPWQIPHGPYKTLNLYSRLSNGEFVVSRQVLVRSSHHLCATISGDIRFVNGRAI